MSFQYVDALPGLAVPQLQRETHLEPIAGIKEIKSVPKRVPHNFKAALLEYMFLNMWHTVDGM